VATLRLLAEGSTIPATLSIANSTISGNTAESGGLSLFGRFVSPGQGGGINNTGTMSVSYSTLSGNAASFGGGIYNGAQRRSSTAFQVGSSLNNEAPTVVSVQRAGVQNSTFLVITFSEPMNARHADDIANYRLVWDPGSEGDLIITIRSARYNVGAQTVTLRLAQRLPLSGKGLLTVVGTPSGGLMSTSGVFLDGNGTGQPGSDYTAIVNA
jgi:hypothetical protein